jgi:CDGSH-type Zn-finger protein
MARLIRHEQTGPYRIDPKDFPKDGKAIWICGCGLSATMPYCDKAHKACAAEKPGVLYVYDPVTKRVIEERPEPGTQPPV